MAQGKGKINLRKTLDGLNPYNTRIQRSAGNSHWYYMHWNHWVFLHVCSSLPLVEPKPFPGSEWGTFNASARVYWYQCRAMGYHGIVYNDFYWNCGSSVCVIHSNVQRGNGYI
jgi:hypothetical protein